MFYRLEISRVESSHHNPVLENTRDFNSMADSRVGGSAKLKDRFILKPTNGIFCEPSLLCFLSHLVEF